MSTRRTVLGGLALAAFAQGQAQHSGATPMTADVILHSGLITTLDRTKPTASATAIKDGVFVAVGSEAEVMAHAGPETKIIDLKRPQRVLPGPDRQPSPHHPRWA
jgi:hypothetical protein